jgi:hypothetical protein
VALATGERARESGLPGRPGCFAIGLVMPLPIRGASRASLSLHRHVTFGVARCTLPISILTCLKLLPLNPMQGVDRVDRGASARGIAGV